MEKQSPERIEITPEKLTTLNQDNIVKHISRYRFATNFLTPSSMTLDCACGVGYGSDILAEKSAKVIGVYYDETAIKTARNTYTRKNIEFRIENIADLSFPDSYFNTIVSLETLEHVPFELSKLFLSNAAGWLCNGGSFIGSSPMLRYRDGAPYITNPYHVNELPKQELLELIHTTFPKRNFDTAFFWQNESVFKPLGEETEGFCVFVATQKS